MIAYYQEQAKANEVHCRQGKEGHPMKLVYRCLCAVLGAILGAGCSNNLGEPVEYGPMPEYGVPTGRVRVDGRVLDGIGAPIPGIEVALATGPADTTDADGNWAIDAQGVYIPCADGGAACIVEATDIDGAANGGPFPAVEATLDLEQTAPGAGYLDVGTWEQHGVDIAMDDAAEYGPPRASLPQRRGAGR